MASCSGNGSRGHHQFTLNVNETGVSGGAENYSRVSWDLILSPIQNGWDWNYSGAVGWKVIINGTEYSGTIDSYDGYSNMQVSYGALDVTHNSDGTKSIDFSFEVWDNVSANYLPGYASGSGSLTLTTIPRYANITASVTGRTVNSVSIAWSTDANVDQFQYKLDSGSWVDVETNIDKRSGSFTIYGLTPNTSYLISFDAKRKDSQLWSTWGGITTSVNTSTNNIGIVWASNFDLGSGESITFTNPNDGSTLYAAIYLPDAVTLIAPYRAVTGTSYTFNLTDEELDRMYKLFGTGNTLAFRVYLKTVMNGSSYYDFSQRTCTLTGNQKTIHTKVSDTWRRGKLWVKVDDTWKRAVVWTKINDTWKRGI